MSPDHESSPSDNANTRKRTVRWLSPKRLKYIETGPRLMTAALVAGLMAAALPSSLALSVRVLCIWDAAMFCFLGLTWLLMVHLSHHAVRKKAQQEDFGQLVILGFIVAAATVSVMAIAFLLKDAKTTTGLSLVLHVALAIATIVGAWLLVHTIFAAHYARGYYQDSQCSLEDRQREKLSFPNELEPDYWDFLYFSVVIGMTSQVSDVQIMDHGLRRLALGHSVLAFFFNTTIVAMSINIIAGLL